MPSRCFLNMNLFFGVGVGVGVGQIKPFLTTHVCMYVCMARTSGTVNVYDEWM